MLKIVTGALILIVVIGFKTDSGSGERTGYSGLGGRKGRPSTVQPVCILL